MLLLILTLLAVTAVSTTGLGEKMAANLKDQRTAFQASESGMRAGEGWLVRNQFVQGGIPATAGAACTDPTLGTVCARNYLGNLADASLYGSSFWNSEAVEYGTGTREIGQASADPRYVIEYRDVVPDDPGVGHQYADSGRAYYRVYGYGVGATPNSTAIVVDHFGFRVSGN
jgi:Tfp pilus assembly protein PilX